MLLGLSRDRHVFRMSGGNPPALTVQPGDAIVVETEDGFGGVMKDDSDPFPKIDFDRVNQATGPIYVEGAEPGDTLVVEILDIRVGDKGVTTIIPSFGVLKGVFKEPYKKVVPVRDGKVLFLGGIELPVRPVIGTIGVAAGEGEPTTLFPGPHGGNMDIKDVTTGSKIFFPVFHKGALLALGDVKATMGDGESNGTGIEIATETTIRILLIKGNRLERPRLETASEFMTIAMAKSIEEASRLAVLDMVDLLVEERGLSREEAYTLVGAAADVKIGNLVDPEVTVRVSAPKEWLARANQMSKYR